MPALATAAVAAAASVAAANPAAPCTAAIYACLSGLCRRWRERSDPQRARQPRREHQLCAVDYG